MLHIINEFFKKIYSLSKQIPKADRFGIWSKIQNICLESIELIITASLEVKNNKLQILESTRIKVEVLKGLIRLSNQLHIIKNKKYIELTSDLQEISKMTNGWIKYLS
ncbi:MAG: four helix bundle protein [Candidatus Komeilibacteria bacterium]